MGLYLWGLLCDGDYFPGLRICLLALTPGQLLCILFRSWRDRELAISGRSALSQSRNKHGQGSGACYRHHKLPDACSGRSICVFCQLGSKSDAMSGFSFRSGWSDDLGDP